MMAILSDKSLRTPVVVYPKLFAAAARTLQRREHLSRLLQSHETKYATNWNKRSHITPCPVFFTSDDGDVVISRMWVGIRYV